MKLIRILVLIVFLIPCIVAAADQKAVADKYKWNLNDIFKTNDDFLQARQTIEQKLPELEKYKGKLGDSPQSLQGCLDLLFEVYQINAKLDAYTGLHYDQNLKNLDAQKRKGEIAQLGTTVREKTAWVTPEIQALGMEKIESFLAQDKALQIYRHYLMDILRIAQHILPAPEEAILSSSGLMAGTAYNVYSAYTSSDMDYPTVKLSDGTEVKLMPAAYTKYRAVDNREDRKLVFDEFWKAHQKDENTFGVLMDGQVERDWFYAKTRNYDSSVEAALDANNIPLKVYTQLVADMNQNLNSLHRYLLLRKQMLGLDKLYYYDMNPPIVKDVAMSFPYDQSEALILDAMKPMGEEYHHGLEQAFANRWVDVYPTEGKRSGAYSNGADYSGHPYVLLNYNDDYESISTLAHELGHSMHSYFSNSHQPYPTSDYPIFVAEVASTFNEILLNEYLIAKEQDPTKKLFLLGNQLERFRQTVFRQTMFAEFELETHKRVENGQTLTGADLTKLYLELLRKYHGQSQGVCTIDDLYGNEWSYIPHFYYDFYVYQYATGQIASTALAEKVLAGEKGSVERYLTFLESGSSQYPIDILKKAGVDLTTSEPFAVAMKSFNRTMDRIEAILKEIEANKKKQPAKP